MVVASPTVPSQYQSPPGRDSGWAIVSRFTTLTSAPGSTRSTVGLKQSSLRARVVPLPSVAFRWQPAPAEAGAAVAAVATVAAATTARSRTTTGGRRRRMTVSSTVRLMPLLHRRRGPGSRRSGSAAGGPHRRPGLVDVVDPDDQAAPGGQVGQADVDAGLGQGGEQVGQGARPVLDVGHDDVVLAADHEPGPGGRLAGLG